MKDVNHLITEHLDIWTSAIEKKSSAGRGNSGAVCLYGIKKLRELILELAVRGQLVPQDGTDEPADALLEKLNHQQADMFARGLIKKPKPLAKITDDDIPFVTPSGWKWCRISQLGHDWGQKVPDNTITYIDVGSIDKELGLVSEPTVLGARKAPSRARKLVRQGTVIYSTVRPYLLNIAVVTEDFEPEPIASTAFAIVHPFEGVLADYLYRYLRSPTFISYVEGCQTGIAYPAINDKQFFSGLVPLPPTAEQNRIVAKVDELMRLCDALERQTEDSLKAHQTLVETCLATLTNSQTPEDLTQNWTRIEAQFDTLFTTEKSIQALEAAIVELGVTGLLVPQSDADEPATQLMQRVANDIAAYSKLNRIRPVKPTRITEKESKAERLPSGWIETRLSSLFRVVTDGDHQAPPRAGDGIAFLTIGNISSGQLRFEGCRRVPNDYYNGLPAYRTPGLGDILYTVVGATYGRPVLVEADEKFCVQRHIAILKPSEELDVDYLVWLLKSAWVYNQASEGITGSAQPTLALKPLRNFLVFLPPRAEQERISSKIKQLHQITAQIRNNISMSEKTKISLAGTLTSKMH